jgi:hypothetical protein
VAVVCIVVVVVNGGGLGNGNISIDFWGYNGILKEESVEREITMHVDICQRLSANKYPAIEVGYG